MNRSFPVCNSEVASLMVWNAELMKSLAVKAKRAKRTTVELIPLRDSEGRGRSSAVGAKRPLAAN